MSTIIHEKNADPKKGEKILKQKIMWHFCGKRNVLIPTSC
jgi:hypothetical protein